MRTSTRWAIVAAYWTAAIVAAWIVDWMHR